MRALIPRRLSRRHLLGGAGAAALGGVCGATGACAPNTPAGRGVRPLSATQLDVLRHAARRIVAPDRDGDKTIPSADDVDVVGFAQAWLSRMPREVVRDLSRFLLYLEYIAPLSRGRLARFNRLAPTPQDRVLARLESSSSDLLRAGFEGLRALCFMAYYRDPRTWAIAGYDGPLVGRPTGGWG